MINYWLVGLNISPKEVSAFIKDVSSHPDYIPTQQEIENIISLFLFIKVVNWLVCAICKYCFYLTIAMLIWLVYLDNEVDNVDND